jgi:mono/diheme cytochrome c family protein
LPTATASEIYQQQCRGCHGEQGQGGRGGIALAAAKSRPNADLKGVIQNGRNRMPAFGSRMTATQIDAVVVYVKQLAPAQ